VVLVQLPVLPPATHWLVGTSSGGGCPLATFLGSGLTGRATGMPSKLICTHAPAGVYEKMPYSMQESRLACPTNTHRPRAVAGAAQRPRLHF